MAGVGTIDSFIIIFYLLLVIGLGIFAGKGLKNSRDYLYAGRNMSWWNVGFSIIATETSALTFIGTPAIAYGGSLAFIQIIFGYVLARILLAIFLVPHYFKGEIYSPYQLLTKAFGNGAGRTCAAIFLLAGTLAAGVRVYATCIPLDLMFPKLGITSAILLFVILSLIYTYIGGVKGVIWTETVQFFLFVGGGIFVVCYIPYLLQGSVSEGFTMAKEAGKLQWLNLDWTWNMPFNLWMGLIGATVQVLSSHGADQLVVQRVLSCKNTSDGRKSLILSAVLILPLFFLFLMVGILLWIYYQQVAMKMPLVDGKADYVFPIFILTELPVGVKGFVIVAILAAAMSSVAAAMSALSSVSVMDFVRPITKNRFDEKWYLSFSKRFTLIWAVLLIVVAKISQSQPLIYDWAFSLNGLTSGALLAGLLMALYFKWMDCRSVIVGMCVSIVLMISMQVSGIKIFAWPWFTLLGCLIALITAFTFRFLFGRRKVIAK